MYIIFLAILLAFFLIPTVDALIEMKKPKEKDSVFTVKTRCKNRWQSIAFLWGGILAVFIMCSIGKIGPQDIGFRKIIFLNNHCITVIALILFWLASAFFLYQTILPLISAKQREEAKKQLANDKKTGIVNILPQTKKERWQYAFLSLSAGVCEEILYRGFAVFILQAVFPSLPIYLVAISISVIFGIGHFYQGIQGVITTGIIGALFMCLFLATGSLIPGIVLHFLVDLSSTFLLWEEQAL